MGAEVVRPPAGRSRGWLSDLLLPVSWVYGCAAASRRRRLKPRARRLDRPVVSVGNLTLGGTGKTPVVEMIARDLLALGHKPAVLSRGYGVHAAAAGGDGLFGNDEFHVLRANLPQVLQLQGKDRGASGAEAIRRGADVLVLDDGFQHVRLHRDLDWVLVDALAPFGGGRVLPAGLLREPLGALAEADLIGITRSDQVAPRMLSTLSAYIRSRFPGIPQVLLATRAVEWSDLAGRKLEPGALRGKEALAFCGIGNPEAFRRQLEALGVGLRALLCFRDHHAYTEADLERVRARAAAIGAEEVVMTQKDAVKIALSEATVPWKFLRIESRITKGAEEYHQALDRLFRRANGDAT